MADGRSLIDTLHKQIAVWILAFLAICASVTGIWWFASDIVVAIINAFEIIAWVLGLLLWPFRI